MKPLILLHGALGSGAGFDALRGLLSGKYDVHTPDFSGHGHSLNDPGEFHISGFAQDVLDYMDAKDISSAHFFGYSMGGYVALYLAQHYPARVSSIVTLATKLQWNEAIAARETAMLDPDKMEQKVPRLAAALAAQHNGKDWKKVVHKTAAMLLVMGRESPLSEAGLAGLTAPILLLLGDRDKMVGLEETIAAFKRIPGAQMGMLPGTSHPLEQVDPELIAFYLHRFFKN